MVSLGKKWLPMLLILNYAESRKFELPTPVSEVENQKWKAGRPRSILGFLINGLVLFLQLKIDILLFPSSDLELRATNLP